MQKRLAESPATLVLLPNELLLCILGYLLDIDLSHLIGLCRRLRYFATHILMERHCHSVTTGKLTLRDPPSFLLPALHGALAVKDIRRITMGFSPDIRSFRTQARALAELVNRLPHNEALEIDLSLVDLSDVDTQDLANALQLLMNGALKKGCYTLTVGSNPSLKVPHSHRRSRSITARQIGSHISGYLKGLLSPSHPQTGVSPGVSTSKLVGNLQKAVLKWDNFTTSTDLIFRPPLLNWTLGVLNSGRITELFITTKGFGRNLLADVLPKVHVPSLQNLALSATREDLGLQDLAQFLQRHSNTLIFFMFSTSGAKYISPPSQSRTPHVDFNSLRSVHLSMYYIPWFFRGLISVADLVKNVPRHLSEIKVIVCENPTGTPTFSQALETISDFGKLKGFLTGLPTDWMATLTLNVMRIEVSLFISWLKAFAQKGTLQDPSLSKLSLFYTVTNLNLKISGMEAHLEDDLYQALLPFLLLFPNLTQLGLNPVSGPAAAKRHCVRWNIVKERCILLGVVKFNDFEVPIHELQRFSSS